MSDEEDYSSADDEDYVPSDKEGLSEEDESGEEEDLAVLNEGEASENTSAAGKGKRKRKSNTDFVARKRKGGIKLDDEAEKDKTNEAGDSENKELKQEIIKEKEQLKEVKEKQKADDLWASFLTDVGRKPKPTPAPSGGGLGTLTTLHSKPKASTLSSGDQTTTTDQTNSTSTSSVPQKITVTKIFDFAGEEVKIKEDVNVESKEGQQELKRLEAKNGGASDSDKEDRSEQTLPSLAKSSPKPAGAGGLGSVLGKIGKKNKLSTLTKSKLDWDSYKKDEGIDEDLKIHNRGKEGYIERIQFLQRADVRQFEIEKSLRQSSSKR